MDIRIEQDAALTRLHLSGRLDGHWAGHLTQALDEQLRLGNDRVCLHLGELAYISSLGLRVLISANSRFRTVSGSFSVTGATGNVLQVLQMAGMLALLEQQAAAPVQAAAVAAAPESRQLERGDVSWEVFTLPGSGMRARVFGDPALFNAGGYSEEHCQPQRLSERGVGLGLGAFAQDFAGNRERFGEYLTVAGAAACQPSGASTTCDTLLTEGEYVPELQALHGIGCEGEFTRLLRFEPAAGAEPPTLSSIAAFALECAAAPIACIVIAAESESLSGAALRRSPVLGELPEDPFGFPDVRDWLSIVGERAHAGMSVLACGVVADPCATVPDALRTQLRPLGAEDGPLGHLHAAVFRFRPQKRGKIELLPALRPFFEHDAPQAVLHLMGDDREEGSVEESRFRRGVCWVAAITAVDGGAA
jgi:anti-anti-sigma factor